VKNWPEAKGDDASIHVESTSTLIGNINQVLASLKKVEGAVKADAALKKSLQECQIPLDLLDLLDSNLNPDCFLRGLVRESLGQLAGLKRRKLALELAVAAATAAAASAAANNAKKRPRVDDEDEGGGGGSGGAAASAAGGSNDTGDEPAPKKAKAKAEQASPS
jgi:hypothetical protein